MAKSRVLSVILIVLTSTTSLFSATTITIPTIENLTAQLSAQSKGIRLTSVPLFLDALAQYPNEFPQSIVTVLKPLLIQSPRITRTATSITVTGSAYFFGVPSSITLDIQFTKTKFTSYPRSFALFYTTAPIRVRLLIIPSRNIILSSSLPELSKYKNISLGSSRFIVSTISPYKDTAFNKTIYQGATVYGLMDITTLGMDKKFIAKIKEITASFGAKSVMGGKLATKLSATALNLEFQPIKPVLISSMIDITTLDFPDSFKNILTTRPIAAPQITFTWWAAKPDFYITGNIPLAGTNALVSIYLKREMNSLAYATFNIPSNLSIASLFPSSSLLDAIKSRTLTMYLAPFALDLAGNVHLDPGLNLVVTTNLSNLPFNANLQTKINSLFSTNQQITSYVRIPAAEEKTQLSISLQYNQNAQLQQLMNLSAIAAPAAIKTMINSAAINKPLITFGITGNTINKALLQGPITMANTPMAGQLQFIQQADKSYASYLSITPPTTWKISGLLDSLKFYDLIPLQNPTITIADKATVDPKNNQPVPVGFALSATLQQSSYFANVGGFLKQFVKLYYPAIDITKNLTFTAIADNTTLKMAASIPTTMSIDLNSLAQKLTPPVTAFVQSVAIGQSSITIVSDRIAAITAPITIKYQGSTTPITATGYFTVANDKTTLSTNNGDKKSLLSFTSLFNKPWLTLANGSININFVYEQLTPATPLPTQITFDGLCTLGISPTFLSVQSTGVIGLSDVSTGNCIITMPLGNSNLSQIVRVVASIFGQQIALPPLAPIQLNGAKASIVLGSYTDPNISKVYSNEILFDGSMLIGALKGTGRLEMIQSKTANTLGGTFPLEPFKGSALVITGASGLSQAATPLCIVNLDSAKTAAQQQIELNCVIQIPKLNLQLAQTIPLTTQKLQLALKTKIFNQFSIIGKLSLSLANPDDFTFECNLGNDFTSKTYDNLMAAVSQLKNVTPNDLAIVQTSINNLRQLTDKVPTMLQAPRDENSDSLQNRIRQINTRLDELNKSTTATRSVDLEKEALLRERDGLQVYLNALKATLAGKAPKIATVLDPITKQATALNTLLAMSQTTINKIKSFRSENITINQPVMITSGADLKKGNLPKINFSIPLAGDSKLELKGFAFDPTQADTFYRNLAQHIINNWPIKTTRTVHRSDWHEKPTNVVCTQQYFYVS